MSVNGSVLSRLQLGMANTVGTLAGWPRWRPLPGGVPGAEQRPHRELQAALWALYEQSGVYDDASLALAAQGTTAEPLRALRQSAHRSVEFFVSTIWPGVLPDALPIEVDEGANAAIVPAIEQVWQWSNWSSQKQVVIRKAAAMGEVFVKVAQTPNGSRVYFQLIDPRHVIELDTDERGYLTRIRVDVPKTEQDSRDRSRLKALTRTEVWEKTVTYFDDGTQTVAGGVRVWEHDKGDEPDLDKLDGFLPAESKTFAEMGPPGAPLTFIPIVQCQWQDRGEQHGAGAYVHAVEKLLEADRIVSRLHQQLYRANTETWVLEAAGRVDSLGREIPPPQVDGLSGSSTRDDGRVQVGDSRLVRVPSGWTMQPKIAPINYADALAIADAHVQEIRRDLPELAYFDATELGANASGRARRIHLAPAIDRALEARANCEEALIRLNQMALTIGQNAGLPLFRNLGTFEKGAFAHRFAKRDVLPPDRLEEAQADLAEAQALVQQMALLVSAPPVLLERAGYTAEQVVMILAEREAAQQPAQAAHTPVAVGVNGSAGG
jgi:hypothetical protein